MKIKFHRSATILVVVAMLLSLFTSVAGAAPAAPVTFTILHTNDFHGQLEASGSNPGMPRTAAVIEGVRASFGVDADKKVLLVDAGDEMQGSLLSNLGDGTPTGKGMPTIGTYNAMSYDVATFGNHEFDWGQVNLTYRTTEATYPYVTANIVKLDGATCASSGWTKPDFADAPYQIVTMGTTDTVKVAFIGVTTTEVPTITVATATAGLCFKDPTEAILHYYDEMKTAGADVIVVLSHLGYTDGGYGYGLPVVGDQTLAKNLISAGKPVNLIIGGHSHTDLAAQTDITVTGKAGKTTVVQAHYNGRKVGRADVTVGTNGSVSVAWTKLTVSTAGAENTAIKDTINSFKTPAYLTLVNTPIGFSQVDLSRWQTQINPGAVTASYAAMSDNMMSAFIDDAIYNYLNTDSEPTNDIDMFFNNAGGIRTDWCWNGTGWVSTGCTQSGLLTAPAQLTYGNMFTILPFGNATVVGKMTGAQILEVLNFAPNAASGLIQPAGLKFKYYRYTDTQTPGSVSTPYAYAWGAYDVTVLNKTTGLYEPLDLTKTYSVGTNEFLAPAGGDSYNAFKYMTNVTYWGDMLNAVNAYVTSHFGTPETAYKGPNNNGTLDGRIGVNGNGDFTYDAGEIIPLTILHHNDSHGNLTLGNYVGYTQLATLIKQERAHNPNRTLLLSGGDNIQGDAMMYYFKSAGLGYAADGTVLPDSLKINPLVAAFNSMNYDAVDLGNHEFNFGSQIFKTLKQATFPILGANVADTGAYGLAEVGVKPYVEKTLGPEAIKIAILGITNHRVPNYELPSNIPGLTFSDPIAKAQELSDELNPGNDVVIALTHIGFTEDPKSVEVDKNVDTNLAQTVTGIDAIIGSHSHTNPASGFGNFKYLPSIIADPDGKPVIIGQAYRYNNTLGEVVLGLRLKAGGGYEVVSQTGRFLTVTTATTEDAATKAIIDPYVVQLSAYNSKFLGQTTTPIDSRNAYIGETNAANLQADASMYELKSHGIAPDFHLSGAMTRPTAPNDLMFPTATLASPQDMTVTNMFTLMPYENSLVVLSMNGPQLKAVLERAYRNYYYYKYVPGYGGYSYYTTCMIDTNFGNQIVYNEKGTGTPPLPDGNNVVSLVINGKEIDFTDAATYYKVSTVNYLAAGSCNFNNGGVSLWPLNQIVNDTQYYVRDAVIDYITYKKTVSPTVEGRLNFIVDTTAPAITINMPVADATYQHSNTMVLDFEAVEVGPAGLKKVWADLDGITVTDGQLFDLYTLSLGDHTLTVNAVDKAGNASTQSATFHVSASLTSLTAGVPRVYQEGKIDNKGVYTSLMAKLSQAQKASLKVNALNAFINEVRAQSGKHIDVIYANALIEDALYLIAH